MPPRNWDDSETILLAEMKREAIYRGEEGSHVWHEISQSISGRSANQCKGRWDTLKKVHRAVQEYCSQTGRSIDDKELATLKLATSFGRAWYSIVRDACDHREAQKESKGKESKGKERKRKEIRNPDRAAVKLSKGSGTPVMKALRTAHQATTDDSVTTSLDSDFQNNTVSQSRETLDHVEQVAMYTVPNAFDVYRDSFFPLTHLPTSDWTSELEKPSLEEENLTLESEVNALRNQLNPEERNQKLKEEKALLLHKQPPHATQQHEEPPDDGRVNTLHQIEYAESEPTHPGLPDECPDDAQCNGAETEAEVMVYDRETGKFDFEDIIVLNLFMSKMSLSKTETLAQHSASTVSEGTITKESSDNSILEALDTKPECVDLEAASKVIELGVRLCCTGCKKRLTKKILKVDGIQKLEFKFDCHRVIVTAKAEPEVVLKHAQMAKKKVMLLSTKKLIAPKF